MDIEQKVGEVDYTFQRMKTMKSLVFKAKLLKIIGPGLSGMSFKQGQGFLDSDITGALGAAMSGINPEEIALFIKETIMSMVVFPAQVGKNGTSDSFDKYYDSEEKEVELLEAFVACVQVQTGGVIEFLKKKLSTSGLNTPDSSSPAPPKDS
jgi:hypothetical protein